ncbi:hypothetical protein [Lentisalinibacter salinarum]|uniref:hypothetical protein n=1 Tax=Lentisalinibacter salinarum TaxID=2992239 RepID=UPI00386719E4
MQTEYFAFTESIDPIGLSPYPFKDPAMLDDGWYDILMARGRSREVPTHLVRLDCIAIEYFLGLDWIKERIADAEVERKQKRREDILSLDANRLRVVHVLVSDRIPVEQQYIAALSETQWHHILLSEDKGLPVLVAPDPTTFEVERSLQYFDYQCPANEDERSLLYNVFNVDFIDEMPGGETDDRGPGGGDGPWGPGGLRPVEGLGNQRQRHVEGERAVTYKGSER